MDNRKGAFSFSVGPQLRPLAVTPCSTGFALDALRQDGDVPHNACASPPACWLMASRHWHPLVAASKGLSFGHLPVLHPSNRKLTLKKDPY